jgi:hypothetical protein
MPENRKPPTDFTIDCILSKSDNQNGDQPRSPINHRLNKVLDNNPWISKCPLALTFNPSSHRKSNVPPSPITPTLPPNYFSIFNPPATINYAENVVKVTQHFTSIHNHFYPASATSTSSESTSNSDDFRLLPKFDHGSLSDDKSSSDSDVLSDNISLNLSEKRVVDLEIPSLLITPKSTFKCSVCSKSFDNCELLNVGWRIMFTATSVDRLIHSDRFTKSVI